MSYSEEGMRQRGGDAARGNLDARGFSSTEQSAYPDLEELEAMKLSQVKAVAEAEGLERAAIDAALDEDAPKDSLIDAIFERRERVDEDSDGDEIGPLSCYFPDAQVYQVMKGGIAKDISFIEAEQALLQCEGSVQGAEKNIVETRERRATGGGQTHRGNIEQAMRQMNIRKPQNKAMGWMTTIASSMIIFLVVASLVIVALVDGVIELPSSVRGALKSVVRNQAGKTEEWESHGL